MYYTPNGTPIPELMRWAMMFEHDDTGLLLGRHIGDTRSWFGLVRTSTVWLGLDHSFGTGPPLIFETMSFVKGTGWSERYFERYSTIEQAVAGHARAVKASRRWGWWWVLNPRAGQ